MFEQRGFTWGSDYQSLRIMERFFSNDKNYKKRTKVNNAFSRYSEITYKVPIGLILGPLHFNIYISDIFINKIECDIASMRMIIHHIILILV